MRLDLPVPETLALSFAAVRAIAEGQPPETAAMLAELDGLVSVRPSSEDPDWGGPGAMLNIGMNDARHAELAARLGQCAADGLYVRFVQSYAVNVARLDPDMFDTAKADGALTPRRGAGRLRGRDRRAVSPGPGAPACRGAALDGAGLGRHHRAAAAPGPRRARRCRARAGGAAHGAGLRRRRKWRRGDPVRRSGHRRCRRSPAATAARRRAARRWRPARRALSDPRPARAEPRGSLSRGLRRPDRLWRHLPGAAARGDADRIHPGSRPAGGARRGAGAALVAGDAEGGGGAGPGRDHLAAKKR